MRYCRARHARCGLRRTPLWRSSHSGHSRKFSFGSWNVVVSEGLCRPPAPSPPLRRSRGPPRGSPLAPSPHRAQRLASATWGSRTSRLWGRGLYQSVGVEQDAFASIDFDLLLLVAHPRHKPKGHPPGPQFLCVPTTPEVGKVVARVGVAQASAPRLEDGVEAGYEHVGWDASHQRLVDSG